MDETAAGPTTNTLTKFWSRRKQFRGTFNQWLWTSPGEDPRLLSSIARAIVRVVVIAITECDKSRITLRASSLTFTVVLSIVPTLALGTAVLKGLGAGDQMRSAAYKFINQIEKTSTVFSTSTPEDIDYGIRPQPGQSTSNISPPDEILDQGEVTAEASLAPDSTLTGHLHRAVDTIFDYVERTDFATLGAFGIFGMVIAVLSVIGNIERSMNAIWKAESNRPFGRKLIDYLALMILLPVTVNLTLATEATIQSPALLQYIEHILPGLWLQNLLLNLLPIMIILATFTLLYRFLPNTRVRMIPAFLGGISGGLGWFVIQVMYIKLQLGVARYNAIYGSFATVPLFLFWIYMGWLVFLVGAEIAFACQVWRQYLPNNAELTPLRRLAMSFETLNAILEAFGHRQSMNQRTLAKKLHSQEGHIKKVLHDLELHGLIRRLNEAEEEDYLPAAPAGELKCDDLVRMVFYGDDPAAADHQLSQAVLTAAVNAAKGEEFLFAGSCRPCTLLTTDKKEDKRKNNEQNGKDSEEKSLRSKVEPRTAAP